MSQPISWAALVREGRAAKGWTLDKLAEVSGISKGELSRIERGRRTGYLDTILVVAKSLDIDLNRLVTPMPDADVSP